MKGEATKKTDKDSEKKQQRNPATKQQLGSNESGAGSSDTEKTSSSFFKTNTVSGNLNRLKELPSFYSGYASLDEFLSAASSDNNGNRPTSSSSGGITTQSKPTQNKTAQKRQSRGERTKSSNMQMICSSSQNNNGATTISKAASQAKQSNKNKRQAQAAIDEMNRQYDHNLCLDRFINDIEQQQNEKKSEKEVERDLNTSPSNSSLSSSSSNMPQSNEDTDSGSRNSESIQSSENAKNEKDSNTNSSNSSNNGSGKEDKTVNTNKEFPKSSGSEQNGDHSKTFSSMESSGIGSVMTGETCESMDTSEGNQEEKIKNYKGGKLGRKRKRGYIYNPKPVIEKPPKQFVPDQEKDQSYWDKRQRNNEAARRSREMRRVKEKETHDKLDRLKKENEALRVAITLLIQRNRNLEFIINELEKTDGPPAVPVTC